MLITTHELRISRFNFGQISQLLCNPFCFVFPQLYSNDTIEYRYDFYRTVFIIKLVVAIKHGCFTAVDGEVPYNFVTGVMTIIIIAQKVIRNSI